MKTEIGIGIIDVYSDEDLEKCKNSIPEDLQKQIYIISNRKNAKNGDLVITKQVPYATLRNYLIQQLRIQNYQYYFIIDSNVQILNPDVFEHTINLARTFGTWFMTGPSKKIQLPIEDDDAKLTLELSPELNTHFLFLYSGIIKNFGYFDERYYNTKELDVVDYIEKLRTKEVYPPRHYNPTIGLNFIDDSSDKLQKINHKDIPRNQTEYKPENDKSLELSCAYFYHKHKYLPNQNEPAGLSQNELVEFMEKLQKQYGKQQ